MNKKLIHSRFAKHLKDYDENAKVQKHMAEKLISLCSSKKYKNILELGCGTGLLTKEAVKNLDFESYIAVDIVEECEDFINKIDSRIKFQTLDIEDFPTMANSPDLIISNAALQWTKDFEQVVKNMQKQLAYGGELLLSTFGKENYRELFFILGTSLKYYSESELKEILPDAIIYPQEIHIMSFKSPKDVLKHLKLTGVNGIENHFWTKSDLKNFENAYSNICVKFPTLTYNPIYIKITNPTVG